MTINTININDFLGDIENCYLGYSLSQNIRRNAASGGIVSSILLYLLESREVDGALVSKISIENGEISSKTFIATTSEEILDCRSSIYFDVSVISNLNQIRNFDGRLAIVGLPCHLSVFRRIIEKDEKIKNKINLMIGLFCGHNSQKELLDRLIMLKKINKKNIKNIIFRRGHWRGNMYIYFNNGEHISFPFQDFSLYQNLHFFSLRKCLFCSDHTGELSDISCGDAWLTSLKRNEIKHSIFISRNKKSEKIINNMIENGLISSRKISPFIVFGSQKRSLIYHKSIKARAKVARLFGMKINVYPETSHDLRWNDLLAAFIVLTNYHLSKSEKFNNVIFHIPRPILYLYLGIFKILTNF